MKVYPSRIGWEIWVPTALLLAYPAYVVVSNAIWPAIIIMAVVVVFIALMVRGTQYVISADKLLVKCWPVVDLEISIDTIHRIRKTWNPISSPAASYIGRIEILYAGGKSCIISPRDRKSFLRDLREKNRSINTSGLT